jgi:catechol 2,3-dioxygenase-like lactoylglutathione lyase family enzyme
MSRVQLALNVSDIDQAVSFYSKLFSVEPAKRMPGYANFAITEPPLKLVLIQTNEERGTGITGALNHLGIEEESSDGVIKATEKFLELGMKSSAQQVTTCCFAIQDKVWVNDPDGAPWEVYTVLGDAAATTGLTGDGACCTPSDHSNACC